MADIDSVFKRYDNGHGFFNRADDSKIRNAEVRAAGGYEALVADTINLPPADGRRLTSALGTSSAARQYTAALLRSRLPALGVDAAQSERLIEGLSKRTPQCTSEDARALIAAFAEGAAAGKAKLSELRLLGNAGDAIADAAAANTGDAIGTLIAGFDMPFVGYGRDAWWSGLHENREDALRNSASKLGLTTISETRIDVPYRDEFVMHFAGPAFRGSETVRHSSPTTLATVKVMQKPGAGPEDPALIVCNYNRPGGAYPTAKLKNEQPSSMTGLFFVPHAKDIGAIPDSSAGAQAQLDALFATLEKSPIYLRAYTTGYGRVGTQHGTELTVGSDRFFGEGTGIGLAAAACLAAVTAKAHW